MIDLFLWLVNVFIFRKYREKVPIRNQFALLLPLFKDFFEASVISAF